MSIDGLTLYLTTLEIKALIGGRIDKVQQPGKDELLIGVRAHGENHKLLLSASAAHARAQLTWLKRTNPAEAPTFCMLLRRRLIGGTILSIEQPNLDRVLVITIEAQNDLGDRVAFQLIAELMGKHSNIILVNEHGLIIDAIRRIGIDMSQVRIVLPGAKYELPPQQSKLNPLEASEADFAEALSGAIRTDKALVGRFYGLSPSMASMLISELGEAAELHKFYQKLSIGECSPTVLLNKFDEPIGVLPFAPKGEHIKSAVSISQALDEYYAQHDVFEHMHKKTSSVRRVLKNNIERCERKIGIYNESLGSDKLIEQSRLCGELITANMHVLKTGMDKAALLNYYLDPPNYMEIKLEPRFSPGENAQRYYKRYQKLKSARDMASDRRAKALEELDYLEGQLDNLDKCTAEAELNELIDELKAQGYIMREKMREKQRKQPETKPMRYVSSDGIEICVGKNNRQNDNLTLRFADGEDIWLHTKNIPGSHVLIKSDGEAPNQTLIEAGHLAAYFSKARGGENVPVDYTPRKHIKKPSGSKPGMVIYSTNKTIFITPDEAVVKRLKRME